ncbi:hypothetical protein B0A55_09318 [Friedmanniomyces simplex]|uniref:Vacuolar protein sorting-associated protein 62 n=1 Tax=Friedmanniomyces simplex TaxID=329884 RepID=A0A4U0WZK8_9PEZI|nr:hypothetical protein B0A55_09318 [Friedmanniomyces simplex]
MSSFSSIASLLALVGGAFSAPLTRRQAPPGVPDFVLTYAPIVYLYSADPYRPSDIGTQLTYTQPEVNFSIVTGAQTPLTLDNLSDLKSLGGGDVYLTATDNIDGNPSWLYGVTPDSTGKTDGAVSCAIIVNDHGAGLVDAFYMYFYAFSMAVHYGGDYFGFIVGDHVGDWEHNMIRFQDGVPQAVWYSQHANGEAFTYQSVEKYADGRRPIVHSANGSHANYAITGTHDHTIPDLNLFIGPVEDYTDSGPIWDPTLAAYYYSYDAASSTFAAYDDSTPPDWLYFTGHWGDAQYPNSDPRQTTVFGIDGTQMYSGGPTGPEDKQLNRTRVCPDNGDACIVRVLLGP